MINYIDLTQYWLLNRVFV